MIFKQFYIFSLRANAALRCERRLATLERSETAKRCESLLNALLYFYFNPAIVLRSLSLRKNIGASIVSSEEVITDKPEYKPLDN